ncbi:metallophosphoesterase [Cellulophaga sp. HaHaR_3_176]|uniref:metallophosphoesterase n=1 Tax=Cellulophaga sp. HaHaR_3_176 TaxID=1942464 RepID=UPI001C1FB52C|nr:metallophosphoesterase [Cellulophaga sp. HaHaR_3_176]QWX85245.1 metallophosphoesterase [Cellulophaga sp. HaHaR_3_176]
MLKYLIIFCSLSACTSTKNLTTTPSVIKNADAIKIAVGGDWDDKWGAVGATELSLKNGASHDLILMLGDLSYDGIEDNFDYNIQNAKKWSAKANKIVDNTPILFVAGDHDSKKQDGDVMTYANTLNYPKGGIVMPPTGRLSGYAYEGKYPYLWFNDIIKRDIKVRVVGTSVAFQESDMEPLAMQKYLKSQYAVGSENYKWVEAVYADANKKGYWIIHINHLPWIDMGKNQSFVDSQGMIDLASKYNVNVLLTASSHNIWRTKPLKINGSSCTSISLTTTAEGANPACVGNTDNKMYKKSDGLIQAHVGVAGKTSALSLQKYPDACNANADGEVKHYVAEGTCLTEAISGIVSLTIKKEVLQGDFLKTDGSFFEPYTFIIENN